MNNEFTWTADVPKEKFEQYVEFVVFSNNTAKWKIETLQNFILAKKKEK